MSFTTTEPERVNAAPASAISSALSGAADLDDCFARVKALRFFEAEQYRKSIVGNRVFFTGPIVTVSERERDEGGVVLQLRHAESWGSSVLAYYSAFFQTLAFQLQKDEVVTVLGTLKRLDRASASLEGESLIPQSSGIATTEPGRVIPAPVKDKDDDDAPIADGFKPTDEQNLVLMHLLRNYPLEIDLPQAHKIMQTFTPAHGEREMEKLA